VGRSRIEFFLLSITHILIYDISNVIIDALGLGHNLIQNSSNQE